MKIQILELLDGARKAEGVTVIIDVFRAYTLECCVFAQGAEKIRPIGSLEEAFAVKRENPDAVLFGERGGARVEGCDFGNSPAQIRGLDLTGKMILHTTSAGTQGMVNAVHAQEILTGSLVNARATAQYIKERDPETVSLVAMGLAGLQHTDEDTLCAQYIKSVLEDRPLPIQMLADGLRFGRGKHFFDPMKQEIFPKDDFYICTTCNRFDFAVRAERDNEGVLYTRPIKR